MKFQRLQSGHMNGYLVVSVEEELNKFIIVNLQLHLQIIHRRRQRQRQRQRQLHRRLHLHMFQFGRRWFVFFIVFFVFVLSSTRENLC